MTKGDFSGSWLMPLRATEPGSSSVRSPAAIASGEEAWPGESCRMLISVFRLAPPEYNYPTPVRSRNHDGRASL